MKSGMRFGPAAIVLLLAFSFMPDVARAASPAESLTGSWTCHAKEGARDVAMTLTYRRSKNFLVGEISEDNGAALLDVWLDDGDKPLALRRVLSYDATVEMQVVEETPDGLKLEGQLRHILDTTARVREEIRFTGADAFRAIWEDDSSGAWQVILERSCSRI